MNISASSDKEAATVKKGLRLLESFQKPSATPGADSKETRKVVRFRERSPSLSDAAIVAIRDLGQGHIIHHAVSLARLTTIRTLLDELMKDFDALAVADEQHNSTLLDQSSRQALANSWKCIEGTLSRLKPADVDKVMNLVTSDSELDSSWTQAVESIGLNVAKDVGQGYRDLAWSWGA